MKLSDVRMRLDQIISKEGDLDLGDANEVAIYYRQEGWISGWSGQVISEGLHWSNSQGGHFIGTETHRKRLAKSGSFWDERPNEDELSVAVTVEVRR